MNTRPNWIYGLAGLGLALAIPVQAAPNFMDGVIIVARRDRADEMRQDQRDQRDTRRDETRAPRRENMRDEPHGYGYGYERRQQQEFENDSRPRGRR